MLPGVVAGLHASEVLHLHVTVVLLQVIVATPPAGHLWYYTLKTRAASIETSGNHGQLKKRLIHGV